MFKSTEEMKCAAAMAFRWHLKNDFWSYSLDGVMRRNHSRILYWAVKRWGVDFIDFEADLEE